MWFGGLKIVMKIKYIYEELSLFAPQDIDRYSKGAGEESYRVHIAGRRNTLSTCTQSPDRPW
jgi:hypothetical protein